MYPTIHGTTGSPGTKDMYDYGNRAPKFNREDRLESHDGPVSATDGNFPETGRYLLRVYNEHGRPIRRDLPGAIVRGLRDPVISPDGSEYPSPEAECQQFPAEFGNFMAGITGHPAWIARVIRGKERVTPRLILDIIRGYHWKGGWLAYRPGHTPTHLQGLMDRAFGDYDE